MSAASGTMSAKLDKITDRVNQCVISLVRTVNKIEPGNSDIEKLNALIGGAIRCDPDRLVRVLKDPVWSLRNEIRNRDESFFLNAKLADDVDISKIQIDVGLIDVLKRRFASLSPSEKDHIWDITNNLCIAVVEHIMVSSELAK
jgi:hypothetical protein